MNFKSLISGHDIDLAITLQKNKRLISKMIDFEDLYEINFFSSYTRVSLGLSVVNAVILSF